MSLEERINHDMGKVMGMATKEFAGKTDGKTLADMVREILSG